MNLPNTKVSLPCLTEKDLADVVVAMEEGVEWIGLSFVRDAQDVKELRNIIKGVRQLRKNCLKNRKARSGCGYRPDYPCYRCHYGSTR